MAGTLEACLPPHERGEIHVRDAASDEAAQSPPRGRAALASLTVDACACDGTADSDSDFTFRIQTRRIGVALKMGPTRIEYVYLITCGSKAVAYDSLAYHNEYSYFKAIKAEVRIQNSDFKFRFQICRMNEGEVDTAN